MLYQDEDRRLADERVKKEALYALLAALPPLAAAVAFFALRLKWPCVLAAFLTCSVLIFLFDLRVLPAMAYRRWMRETVLCRTHETIGYLTRLDDEPVYDGRLCFREVWLNIYEDQAPEGERRFLLDASKQIPKELLGEIVAVQSHETYIAGLSARKNKEQAGEEG